MSFTGKAYRTHGENSSNILNGLHFVKDITSALDFPLPIDARPRYVWEVKAPVTDNESSKTNTGQSFVEGDLITWTGTQYRVLGNTSTLGSGATGPTGPGVYVDNAAAPIPPSVTGQLWWDPDDEGGETYPDTFESVSKNLKGKPFVIVYSGSDIDYITYDMGGGLSIIKTFNYTSGVLTSIVLSGDTPAGVLLIKTLIYTGNDLTSVTYT